MKRPVMLRPSELFIDPEVQRAFKETHTIFKEEFDPALFGMGTASRREDGRNHVVDGQHRVAYANRAGFGDRAFPFMQYEGLTREEEAALFLKLQSGRVRVSALDEFRMSVMAGSPDHCDIKRIVESFGLRIAGYQREGGVAAVQALGQVYDGLGPMRRLAPKNDTALPVGQLLSRTLHILTSAWGKERDAFDGILLKSTGAFLLKSGTAFDGKSLARRLSKAGTPGAIRGKIKSLQQAKGGAMVLAGIEVIEGIALKGTRRG